jgi:hypothetical protein
MDHCPESHGVSDLSVEPNILIHGEKPCKFGADDSNDVAQHRDKDKAAVKGKSEPSATRNPDGVFQSVESSQVHITFLTVPSIGKESELGPIEENVEDESPWNKEFALEPVFTHDWIIFKISINSVPARRRK